MWNWIIFMLLSILFIVAIVLIIKIVLYKYIEYNLNIMKHIQETWEPAWMIIIKLEYYEKRINNSFFLSQEEKKELKDHLFKEIIK